MSYESPIEIAIRQMRIEQEKKIEGEVMKAIQDYGITIDKDELIRALQYDRGQYDKGYKDGKAYAVREMQEMLKSLCVVDLMAVTKSIDRIAKEILEETE